MALEFQLKNEETIEGYGSLIFQSNTIKTHFTLHYKPFSIYIETPYNKLQKWQQIGYGKLEGKLIDGRTIFCNNIVLNNFQEQKSFIYRPTVDIVFGETIKAKIFSTKLIGLYLGKAKLQQDDYVIEIKPIAEYDNINSFCETYGNILEGNELIIKDISNKRTNNELIKKSEIITMILSLIYNNNVCYNRYTLSNNNNEHSNVWRINGIQQSSAINIIDLNVLSSTLEILLDGYDKLTEEEKELYKTMIISLNSINGKYLEDRLLIVAQSWEIISEFYNTAKYKLPKELDELKKRIKTTIKDWKAKNDISYDTNIISTRLISSLYWEKVINQIKNFIKNESINLNEFSFDIEKLIKIRNSITHTSRFSVKGEEFENLVLLENSLLSLQLIILFHMGYKGDFIVKKGALTELKNISSLIKKVTT